MPVIVRIYGNYATLTVGNQTFPGTSTLPPAESYEGGGGKKRDEKNSGISGVSHIVYRFNDLDEVAIVKSATGPFGASKFGGVFSYVARLLIAGGVKSKFGIKKTKFKFTARDLANFCDAIKYGMLDVENLLNEFVDVPNNNNHSDSDLDDNSFLLVN